MASREETLMKDETSPIAVVFGGPVRSKKSQPPSGGSLFRPTSRSVVSLTID